MRLLKLFQDELTYDLGGCSLFNLKDIILRSEFMVLNLKNKKCKSCSQAAYTLLEMAIVFTVIGILMTIVIQAYNIYYKKKTVEVTENNVFNVINSVNAFMAQNGRYPCPAPLNVSRDDPAYGFEVQDCLAATPVTPVCGRGANNVCTMPRGAYRLNANTDYPLASGTPKTRVNINSRSSVNCSVEPVAPATWSPDCAEPAAWQGAIPFRSLGLPENVSEDGYGAKLQYAVSENLTNVLTYRKDAGVISVVDERKNPLVNPQGSAHFVVFSSGPDKRGAYSRTGALMAPCPATTVSTADALNCPASVGKGNGDVLDQVAYSDTGNLDSRSAPWMPAATYRQSRYGASMSVPEMYFDDYVRFYTSSESPLWRVADSEGRNIVDLASTSGQSKVGVGLVNRDPVATLELAGNGAASVLGATALKTDSICDNSGNNCFKPEQIAGDNGCTFNADGTPRLDSNGYGVGCETAASKTRMNCPAGSYVTRIYGDAGKAKVECTQDLVITCPSGQSMIGIDGTGKLICEGVASCPPLNVSTCNIAGTWREYTLPSGLQGQTFTTTPIGFSYRATYFCDSGAWRQQSTSGLCECTPVTNQIVENCTDPSKREGFWNGTTRSEFTRVCNANGTMTENTTVIEPASTACTCREGTQTQLRPCDTGFTSGNKVFKRDWQCQSSTSGRWRINQPTTDAQGWYEDPSASTCLCTEASENQQKNCSEFVPGWSGTFTQTRNRTCPAASPPGSAPGVLTAWSPVPTVSTANGIGDCRCNSSYSEMGQDIGCPSGQQGVLRQMRVLCCPGSTNPNCNGVTQGALSPWFVSSNTCAATSYQWTEIASSAVPQYSSSPIPGRAIGSPCTPSPSQQVSNCSAAYSNANYRLVSCRCQ